MKILTTILLGAALLAQNAEAKKKPANQEQVDQTVAMIEKVNDYWQSTRSTECRAFWDNAAYYTGNMAAYDLTKKQEYLDYSIKWAEHNKWMGANNPDPAKWRYKTYGEGQDFVLFADWQICFQVYMDLYNIDPQDYKIKRTKEVMEYQANMDACDFWWWSDALYMGFPIFTKLYKITGDEKLLKKQYECFVWTDSLLFDTEDQLYYRDAKYIYPKVKTACNGGKSFWARGDGWVLAGLAKVLTDLPKKSEYRKFYIDRFKKLAEGVAKCQQEEGYWSRSMLCEDDAPGPETSGTAFFTYGLLWGVNNGILKEKQYKPVIDKAWNYLTKVALQDDGSIGYVQPIGEKPDPTKKVDAKSQAPFGTGAWLLAACEYVKYLNK